MEHQRLYPAEPHMPPMKPPEEWHLTEDEWRAVNRYGTHNQSGMLPEVMFETMEWQEVPGTPYSPGDPGQKARDSSYLYVCVRNNVWKRAPVEDVF